jgi:dTDP-4-dehydrorhamnose 3,5-epimerase
MLRSKNVASKNMQFIRTDIPEIIIIEPEVFGDTRGFFMETYHASRYAQAGIQATFVQDNHSGSRQGTLRGLHYQIQQPQAKLVRVVCGEVYDVVVDIRRSSPSFGKWIAVTLSAENKRQIWVPAGFAHGVYILSEWAELIYKASDLYAPEWERTVLWNDPALGIPWPLINNQEPILSKKDIEGKPLNQADLFD